ncbi:MAG TPA: hypothetical protein VN643_06620 [Pyrinomonadaceae bacterium]|nr:hypothetical protein [Pyrinomonadaceae bacterium]
MLMKFHKFVGANLAVTLIILIAVGSVTNSATNATGQNTSVPNVVDEKSAGTFDCRNPTEYRLVVVENSNRKKDSEPVVPRDLNIVVGDRVISKIELPKESEAKNFSLNSIEKNKAGFEINVDWGSGVSHSEIQFDFKCERSKFYLSKVTKRNFSTTNPDSGNFLDKKKTKVTRIKPNLPIEKFAMIDYL